MFIREVVKRNRGHEKEFIYHRLMESVRTAKGPRQRLLLDLGKLEIPRMEWKALANRIEEILTGQESFVKPPRHIEDLARHYAQALVHQGLRSVPGGAADVPVTAAGAAPGGSPQGQAPADFQTVDMHSLTPSRVRTIGAEALGLYGFEKLGFPRTLQSLGFTDAQVDLAALLIIGRLVYPASELKTARWARDVSAVGELLGTDFSHVSANALYRASDTLMARRGTIEESLARDEKRLYGLEEKIILYDLTNTYFEGCARRSLKARHGRSKEKRSDCPLVTLALVLDGDGFAKMSKVYPGSVSEPGTLKDILADLRSSRAREEDLFTKRPTVVMDAGIATKDNLRLLSEEKYHYVCVSRSKPEEILRDDLVEIETRTKDRVCLKKVEKDGEVYLYCRSHGRAMKEEGMRSRIVGRFEEGLDGLRRSIENPRGRKGYEGIVERLGRLREKYPTASRYYQVEIDHEADAATAIRWEYDAVGIETRLSGSYYIRTDRHELSEEELWRLYMTLLEVEAAFRCLKSELGLRPNFHHKDSRIEGHLFISVLAYHILTAIRRELKTKGCTYRWETIRSLMSTQARVTTSVTTKNGDRIHVRDTTEAEPFHRAIYHALGIPCNPLRRKRIVM